MKVEVDKAARAEGLARNIQSLQDMREVMASHSDMSAQKTLASKHVMVLDSMNQIVESRDLFAASEMEQIIACTPSGPSADLAQVCVCANASVFVFPFFFMIFFWGIL